MRTDRPGQRRTKWLIGIRYPVIDMKEDFSTVIVFDQRS
jgi:hypothetical protein